MTLTLTSTPATSIPSQAYAYRDSAGHRVSRYFSSREQAAGWHARQDSIGCKACGRVK